nr:integrase, catalytic region, zinc finger, CCHC-type, peptidase aspartic, catalytic [Tanacetum cinerariifolium]
MAADHVSSDPVPQCQRTAFEHDSLSPSPQCQENVPRVAGTVTTSNELDLLFSPTFDELLNGSTQVVSKSSAETTADAPNQCQQQHITPLNTQTTPEPQCQVPTQAPIVTSTENINQAETNLENAQVEDDEFINIFFTPVHNRGETSSRHVDSLNKHTFYQRYPSEHLKTRRQLESDGEMCMFSLTVSQIEQKNIKEAMADSASIESMQEEYNTPYGENLDKMKEKGDACIFVGYSTQSRSYRVFNKRTRVIVKTIHVNFDELPHMASDHISSDPIPQCQRTALKHDSLSPGPQCQDNDPYAAETVTTSNELDFLFSPMFDELLNGSTQVVSKSSAETTADAPNQ